MEEKRSLGHERSQSLCGSGLLHHAVYCRTDGRLSWLPACSRHVRRVAGFGKNVASDWRLDPVNWRFSYCLRATDPIGGVRSEEHTSELQSHSDLVCRLLLEKKKITRK